MVQIIKNTKGIITTSHSPQHAQTHIVQNLDWFILLQVPWTNFLALLGQSIWFSPTLGSHDWEQCTLGFKHRKFPAKSLSTFIILVDYWFAIDLLFSTINIFIQSPHILHVETKNLEPNHTKLVMSQQFKKFHSMNTYITCQYKQTQVE